MAVKNSYPELPEIPYKKTSVEMGSVVWFLRVLNVPKAVKIAAYVIFRNESGNGTKGINNNYLGIQADNGRWPLGTLAIGTVVKVENMTGKERRFLAFKSYTDSLAFLINRIQARGLYAGGTTSYITQIQINTPDDWIIAYWREWVTGSAFAQIPANEKAGLISMYNMGEKIF